MLRFILQRGGNKTSILESLERKACYIESLVPFGDIDDFSFSFPLYTL